MRWADRSESADAGNQRRASSANRAGQRTGKTCFDRAGLRASKTSQLVFEAGSIRAREDSKELVLASGMAMRIKRRTSRSFSGYSRNELHFSVEMNFRLRGVGHDVINGKMLAVRAGGERTAMIVRGASSAPLWTWPRTAGAVTSAGGRWYHRLSHCRRRDQPVRGNARPRAEGRETRAMGRAFKGWGSIFSDLGPNGRNR